MIVNMVATRGAAGGGVYDLLLSATLILLLRTETAFL